MWSRPTSPHRNSRPAITLIELIVVMSVIVVLGALIVGIQGSYRTQELASRGTQDLQGWLFEAKQLAQRDKAPRGIRLLADSQGRFSQVQFIAQPGNFTGGTITFVQAGIWAVSGVDLTGGLGTDQSLWPIQQGDFLYVSGGVIRGQVTGVTVSGTQQLIQVNDPKDATGTSTTDWYVVRSARSLPGEETRSLPEGVMVDFAPYGSLPQRSTLPGEPPLGTMDILFTPTGSVTGNAGKQGKVILWIRDANRVAPDVGEQILIVIYTRTGMIATYPVDTASADPFAFTRDPKFRPSGL